MYTIEASTICARRGALGGHIFEGAPRTPSHLGPAGEPSNDGRATHQPLWPSWWL